MFAIVDIETTGGSPADNRIIEIAVIVHDGREITAEFQSLVNPGMPVPKFITVLTGISDQMVKDAPSFGEIAHEVLKLLGDKVFVAHNVNFDYSFLRREFARVNLSFNQRRACTIRLSRRLLPGLPSYSLGNLCRQVGIEIYNQHRAGGDARATARLLELLLEKDNCGAINEAIKKSSRELSLPPHLNRKDFDTLPNRAGIYRFHDSKGRIIYIGKAVNIKKRVAGHFALGSESRSKLNFINEIVSVSYRETGSELVALLAESEEIKKTWPRYNVSQRKPTVKYGIYEYTDQRNYLRLGIMKTKKTHRPLISFASMVEARYFLIKKAREYFLCPKLSGIQEAPHECFDLASGNCSGGCAGTEGYEQYNQRHKKAVSSFREESESFIVKGSGRNLSEYSVVMVEDGIYKGYGFVNRSIPFTDPELVKPCLVPSAENEHTQSIIRGYINNRPDTEVYYFSSSGSEGHTGGATISFFGSESLFGIL